jgi:hypothetical protein
VPQSIAANNGPSLWQSIKNVARKIGNYIPTVCGGGVYNYGGLQVTGDVASVSAFRRCVSPIQVRVISKVHSRSLGLERVSLAVLARLLLIPEMRHFYSAEWAVKLVPPARI